MLGRFFTKKDEPKSSRPPHAVGPPQPRPAATEDSNGGGGFFNLPPAVTGNSAAAHQQPGFTNPNNASYSHSPAKTQVMGGGTQPLSSTFGGLNPSNPYQRPSAGIPSNGGAPPPSLFGGMSVKSATTSDPPAVIPSASSTQRDHKPMSLFGGLELGGSAAATSLTSTVANVPTPSTNPSPLSLSALNIPAATSIPVASTMLPDPPVKRSQRGSSGFNYLDMAPPEATTTVASAPSTAAPSTTPPSSSAIPVVKKKKKPTFRPGFGRQLSDESAAALQRGDLKHEDIVPDANVSVSNSSATSAAASIPSQPVTKATSSTSILKDLTLHTPAATSKPSALGRSGPSSRYFCGPHPALPRCHGDLTSIYGYSATLPAEDLSSLLANMTIRNFANNTTTTVPALVKAHSQRALSPRVASQSSPRASLPSFALHTSTNAASASTSAAIASSAPTTNAANLTPEDRVASIARDLDVASTAFRNGLAQLKGEESHILDRKSMLTKQIAQFNLDLHEVEASQLQAAEDEDFEKADALNATIEKLRHCMMLAQSDLRKCEQDSVAVAKQKEKLVLQHVRSAKGTWNALSKLDEERSAALAALKAEAKTFKATERRRFAFEKERVATELHHVTVNMVHLEEEKAEIESSIASQCTDEYELRQSLLAEQATVAAEIAELEAKLATCRAHMVELDAGIAKADEGIQVVRQKFSRQLKRLVEREKSMLKTKKEVEADEAAMHRAQEGFEATKADFAAKLTALAHQLARVQRDLHVAAVVVRVAEEQNTTRQAKEDRAKRVESQLASLRDDVQDAEKNWALAKHQLADLNAKLAGFRTVIMTAGTALPQLEAEKKQAAAERNFKEAARLSKDIKQLEKDRASADEQIEVLGMELKDAEAVIVEREAAFKAKTDAFQGAEKTLDLEALQGLYNMHHDLRVVLRELSRDDPMNGDDHRSFLRPIALGLVQSEFDHVVAEIEVLEDKYLLEPYVKPLAAETPEELEASAVVLPDASWSDSEDDDEAGLDDANGKSISSARRSKPEATAPAQKEGASPSSSTRSSTIVVDMTPAALAEKIAEVEKQIEAATDEEDYELAAQLDEQLETWVARLAALEQERSCGPSEVDLRAELEALQHAIEALAGQIEHATNEEEYEIAAHLDEDLVAAQTRKTEIQLQLAAMEPPAEDVGDDNVVDDAESAEEDKEKLDTHQDQAHQVVEERHDAADDAVVKPVDAGEAFAPPPASTSLFAGLNTVKSTSPTAGGGSLFGGLAVVAEPMAGIPPAAPTTSLFGGLTMVQAAAVEIQDAIHDEAGDHGADEASDHADEQHVVDEVMEDGDGMVTAPSGEAIEEAAHAKDEDDMEVHAAVTSPVVANGDFTNNDEEEPEHAMESAVVDDSPASSPLFGGLSLGTPLEPTPASGSSSLFGGLSLQTTSPVSFAPLDSTLEGPRSPTSFGSLFGGLSVAAPQTTPSDSLGAPEVGGSSLFGGLSLAHTTPGHGETVHTGFVLPSPDTATSTVDASFALPTPDPVAADEVVDNLTS
ncbi:hypothetical protein H310_10079 [Aphanomyces invadans]|uniref:UVR domain-containing protein n=1 Tax=Aphanomyces invadans TaxID=157072 RepID=A0A024TT11_9STRA|nr:hypothetical protein H310_10079 [Aphanomyces invadans]ETV96771.1 hypothetical protein H310_10079 [Aphanomyces invadans]|eukprot:XP_008874549.1 hypothetical protein H310_10079 [Aphanomyces invadans]